MGPSALKSKWVYFWSHIFDLVFPLTCFGCGQEGMLACNNCLSQVPEPDYQVCPICRVPFSPNGATCKKCSPHTALDGLFVARIYRFRLVSALIHALKYRFLQKAAQPLALLLEESLHHHSLPLPDLIIPVPLHPRRLRYRGFNQSCLLAEILQERLTPGGIHIPIDTERLKRIRLTKPQMKTDTKEERIRNLKDAFRVDLEVAGPLLGKYVWLIDDVATTGTTLDECARALKQAGVNKVWGVVIAR